METITVGDARLEHRVRGAGEPLLLVHGAMVADAFEAMLEASDLASRYQVITYRRRGFGHSSPAPEGRTMSDEAADAIAVLDQLGVDKAHVVGHSYGGALALQLAMDAPGRVHTLSLFEPGLFGVPSAEAFGAGVGPIAEKFQAGDHEGALVGFMQLVGGEDALERVGPYLTAETNALALADLPTLFANDLPVVSGFATFGAEQAAGIAQPALLVLGAESAPLFGEGIDLLEGAMVDTERLSVSGCTHLLQLEKPAELGAGLGAFLARHPMS